MNTLIAPTSIDSNFSLRTHRFDIDGLRALAVLSVIAFHARTPGVGGGYVGVDVFFVISGYLICSILLRDLDTNHFSISKFYERRCRRILPALAAVLLLCTGISLLILSPTEVLSFARGLISTSLSGSNILYYFQGRYFDPTGSHNPLLMTWSLAVEEQFYIGLPLLLWALFTYARRYLPLALVLGCLSSFALSVFCEFRHPEFNFFLPFTRAWELGLGCLLATWELHRKGTSGLNAVARNICGFSGLVMILCAVFFYSSATRFPGYEALLPGLGTLLVLASPGSYASELLSLSPLTFIGAISYSLYLWHWPLLSFSMIAAPAPLPPMSRFLLMVASVFVAALSYHYIEQPFRNQAGWSTAHILALSAILIFALVCSGVALLKTDGMAQRCVTLASIEKSIDLDRGKKCITVARRGPVLTADCFPQPGQDTAIALLGDSHAEALLSEMKNEASNEQKRLIALMSYSCPPLFGYTRNFEDDPGFADACAHFNSTALNDILERADVKTVVLTGAWAMAPEDQFVKIGSSSEAKLDSDQSVQNLIAGIRGEITAIENSGKRVIVIDDAPSLPFVPVDMLRLRFLSARRHLASLVEPSELLADDSDYVQRSSVVTKAAEQVRNSLEELARNDGNLTVIDTKSSFCDADKCKLWNADHLAYEDNNHVSRYGAQLVLNSQFEKAMAR